MLKPTTYERNLVKRVFGSLTFGFGELGTGLSQRKGNH